MKWKRMFSSDAENIVEEAQNIDSPIKKQEENHVKIEDKPAPRDRGVDITINLHFSSDSQVGRAALLLASTVTKEEEELVKAKLGEIGWRSVATEVGGVFGELPQKITRALVGAALNSGVIQKDQTEMHALMHAAFEALDSFIPSGLLEASIGAKIAIIRNKRWIAVSVMGDTAYHAVAHHERFGLGVMHI